MAHSSLWLTDAEQAAWRVYIEAAQRVFNALEVQLQADSDLSQGDFEVLVRLSESPEARMRMSDLADQVLFSRSRLSHAISRLERDGLVRRSSCPSDKRGTFATLTEKGRSHLEAAVPGHVAKVRELVFSKLTSEQVRELSELSQALLSPCL